MPFLSVIVPTMRVGGLDVLFNSLKRQTFTDFELVLVDAHARRRAAIIDKEARDRFISVTAVEPTPNPFPLCAFCHYSNAGLTVARGEVVVFMVDYSRLPPDLLAKHAAFHRADNTGRKGLMMPHRYVTLEPDPGFPRYAPSDIEHYADDVQAGKLDRFMWSTGNVVENPCPPWRVDAGGTAEADADPKLRMAAGDIHASFFHAKNESVRLERCIEAGGWDEDLDGTHGYQDSDFSDRLTVKAGVTWTLDPTLAVDIVNPRHVFPFAKRVRDFVDNRRIWEDKKARGYPPVNPKRPIALVREAQQAAMAQPPVEEGVMDLTPEDPTREPPIGKRQLTVAMIYGEFSSAIHGPFDLDGLYTRTGLTGSESSFFNLARTLAERGHRVVAFCKCEVPWTDLQTGLAVLPISMLKALKEVPDLDAVVAWNEPDYLQFVPAGIPRVVDQQLNDWGYCRLPYWQHMVDRFVFPSEHSRQHHVKDLGLTGAAVTNGAVIPNSVDLALFAGPAPERHPHRVLWASSPDRGLHHLLSLWPDIRSRVPDAELRVFYRLAPWLNTVRNQQSDVGDRARYIEQVLPILKEHGVTVLDQVPNVQMAQEFRQAAVLAYTCDPISYTEGFGCSVLDAAAGGCVPIMSDADALPEVHKAAGLVIQGRPDGEPQRKAWLETIVDVLTNGSRPEWKKAMGMHAEEHSREQVTDRWEALLYEMSSMAHHLTATR